MQIYFFFNYLAFGTLFERLKRQIDTYEQTKNRNILAPKCHRNTHCRDYRRRQHKHRMLLIARPDDCHLHTAKT